MPPGTGLGVMHHPEGAAGQMRRRVRDTTGMPLTGDAFTQYSRTEPTQDSTASGRWIACDESGYGGEQLLNNGRYLVYASVAIDDVEAAPIMQELRRAARIQSPELKFKSFQNNAAAGTCCAGCGSPGARSMVAAPPMWSTRNTPP
ncbi:hypothetical protein DEJ50_32640 [Streptomyces venezuelae]|uniref:Uncharacterized protein n=2 Tax=Streptomyces venezuelae TaxID=54571 RepID=A0A5P2D9P5_STRVZ|nr:hypothetical protein DEJ50_32640 [Streptomyces venezuelae]